MQPVESGRNRITLQSSPHPTRGESADNICYCPDCGARLRLTGHEPEEDPDRTTLPDWLPASGTGSVPPPLVSSDAPEVEAASKSDEPQLTGLEGSSQVVPNPGLPNLGALPAPSTYVDEDEPTRVIRISTELPRITTMHSAVEHEPHPAGANANESPLAAAHAGRKPPVPVRRRSSGEISPSEQRIVAAPPASQPAMAAADPVPGGTSEVAAAGHPELHSPETLRASAQPTADSVSAAEFAPDPPAQPAQVYGSPTSNPASTAQAPRKFAFHQIGFGLGVVVAGALALMLYRHSTASNAQNRLDAAAAKNLAQAEANQQAPVVKILAAQAAPEVAIEASSSATPEPPSVTETREVKTVAARAETQSLKPSGVSRPAQSPLVNARTESTPAEQEPSGKQDARVKQEPVTKQSPSAKSESADEAGEPFDSEAAASALESAAERAGSCRKDADPSGIAVVTITFAPSGRVTTANIGGPPFVGTPTGSCIASTMRSAKVPAFSGKYVTVRKTVTIR